MFGVSVSEFLTMGKIISDECKRLDEKINKFGKEFEHFRNHEVEKMQRFENRIRLMENKINYDEVTENIFENLISEELEKQKKFQDTFLNDKEKAYEKHNVEYGPEDDCSLLIKQKAYREGLEEGMRVAYKLLK